MRRLLQRHLLVLFFLLVLTLPYAVGADTAIFNYTTTIDNELPVATITSTIPPTINPLVGQYTYLNFTARITDMNGYLSIDSLSTYLYHSTTTLFATNNNVTHFTGNCNEELNATNYKDYNCSFSIPPTIQPSDIDSSSWNLTLIPKDNITNGTTLNTSLDVASLLAMNITTTTLSFTNVLPGTNTETLNEHINFTNDGNINLTFELASSDLTCTSGTIPANNLHYATTSFNYTTGTALSTTSTPISSFVVEPSTTPFLSTQSALYFGIALPLATRGTCSGNITLIALAE